MRLKADHGPCRVTSAVRRPNGVAGGGAIFRSALLLAGLLGANLLAPSPLAAAAAATVEKHATCARLGRVIGSLSGNVDQVSASLFNVLRLRIAAPQRLPDGFRFAGGRAVSAGGTTAAHLAWLRGSTMLSFYQAADPGGDPPAGWSEVALAGRTFWRGGGDNRAILWRGGGAIYLLVSDLPAATLLQLASTRFALAPTADRR